jgi:hypothetical protein
MWWSEFHPPRRLVASSTPIERGPGKISTTQTFTLDQQGDGSTRMHAVWDREVSGIPAERVIAPLVRAFIGREIRQAQTEALHRLKTQMEARDQPQPAGSS